MKIIKKLNILSLLNNKRYIWLKNLWNLRNNLNYNSFDQFNNNKPIYKSLLCIINFTNIAKLNNYIKNYKNFFLIKKMPYIQNFNDFLTFYKFNFKKENILFLNIKK